MSVVIGMATVNFTVRFLPLAILSRLDLPRPMLRWLSFIPISVMGALVASEVLRPQGQWRPPLTNPGLWAALLTALVFRLTRSFLGATLVGVLSYVVLRASM
jgi:branched-subunit amino acid transport protein